MEVDLILISTPPLDPKTTINQTCPLISHTALSTTHNNTTTTLSRLGLLAHHLTPQLQQAGLAHGLGEHVGQLVLGRDVLQSDLLVLDLLSDEEVLDLNVLGRRVQDWILAQSNTALIVLIHQDSLVLTSSYPGE